MIYYFSIYYYIDSSHSDEYQWINSKIDYHDVYQLDRFPYFFIYRVFMKNKEVKYTKS